MSPPAGLVLELVENPTEEIADEAITVWADLMGPGHAAMLALTGGNASLIPELGRVTIRPLVLCRGVGHLYTARDETGALVAFALFTLPGQKLFSTPEQETYGFLDFRAKLSPEGQQYYAETMGQDVPRANDELFGITDAEKHAYWCSFAMVRADYQGKGVAKALFNLAFQEAAKTGATVALTTTNVRNVPIYEKIGFKFHGERTMPSPWGDWRMFLFSNETKTEVSA